MYNYKLFEFDNSYGGKPLNLGFIDLFQASELALENNGYIDNHFQKCCEISYVVSGEGVFHTDGEGNKVTQGDIHVISKGKLHSIHADPSQSLRYICIGFNFNHDYYHEMKKVIDFFELAPNKIMADRGELRFLLDMLINEFYIRPDYNEIIIELCLKQILIYVYRLFTSSKPKYYEPSGNKKMKNQTVYNILRYIDSNLFEINSIKDIADNIGYSIGYISYLFSQKTGTTLYKYIQQKKLESAIELLKNGKLTITEISNCLNFDSPQSFCKTFKRYMGCTPTEHRNKIIKEYFSTHDT